MTRVLVVDDEPQILRALRTNLVARDYEVDVAASGEDALALAARRKPDVILLDLGLPGIDGIEVVRGLRGWTNVPIVVLSVRDAEADKIAALDAGADDYVTKPFRFEELDLRVAKTLRRTQVAVQETREQLGGSSLRGDLSHVGLSSLLVLIEMERKTGLLQLRAPNGPSAQVLVREGKVVHARLDDAEEPVDAECVYYLLTWGSGEFEFTACLVEGADRVSVSTTHLLMEGARLMDEQNDPQQSSAVIKVPPLPSNDSPDEGW